MATRRTSYHPSGQVAAEWGDQTYPTYKLYNLRGQMRELRTYQNQTSEPTASTPGYATTTWNYEPATGLLLSKLDANNKGASYTYSDDGKLLTRTWARTISGTRLSTRYTYTPAGQLFTTDYSDTTPDVSIRYDRLGRQLTQTNGLATSTFAYDPATLALDTETITYDLNADGTADFTRVLDRSSDDLGRDKGFQLKNGNTVENEAKYGYHATTARLTEISNPQISNLKFTYDYVGNSSLIDAITSPVHSVDLIWEPTRNVLEKRENRVAGNMISGYQYRVNDLGQRTDVTQTGSVFAAGQGIAWGYDALGQVTSADHTAQNTQDRAYRYDTIGNRLAAEISNPQISNPAGPNTSIYTANPLNQYTAVGNRAPSHDDDGNLRLDGGVNKDNEPREYVWDAENRLISVKRVSDGAPIVTYLYDSQSRRIARTQGSATTLYLYDAWNCIAEYSIQNSAFTLQHSRLWGLDLSGTLQGAGGVGGMLCESQISTTQISNYYPTYDGNGNISEYLAQTGTPAARFEYDPFGNTVVNTDATNQFAYRFSTKPADAATGLYYYGYRYYDPVTGRWPSRDPIEEEGGNNLYQFVENDSVDLIDVDGWIIWRNPFTGVYRNGFRRIPQAIPVTPITPVIPSRPRNRGSGVNTPDGNGHTLRGRPAIDYDGAAHAYHPAVGSQTDRYGTWDIDHSNNTGGLGSDNLGNARRRTPGQANNRNRHGELNPNVIVFEDGSPRIYPDGYYRSHTSWEPNGNPVDSETVNYIALGSGQVGAAILGQGRFTIRNEQNNQVIENVIYVDSRGGNNEGVEISVAAANALGIVIENRGVAGYRDAQGVIRRCPVTINAIFTGNRR